VSILFRATAEARDCARASSAARAAARADVRRLLKVKDRRVQELHHHRADDFPAYVVISSSAICWFRPCCRWRPILRRRMGTLAPWLPPTLILTLGLLQPVKGAIVALQWHM
jgi:uncharacterized protein (DUF983 family)